MISEYLASFSFIWDYYLGPLIPRRRRRDIPSLPDNVLINILSRLPADCVVKFRRVCRHWWALTSSPRFVRLQLQRATPALLVQYDIWDDIWETSTLNRHLHVAVIGETDRKNSKYKSIRVDSQDDRRKFNPRVLLSCDGLLLFGTLLKVKSFFVFNPVTYEKAAIWPKPGSDEGRFCGFFFHPLTSEYKLLLVDNDDDGYRYFTYSMGSRKWRRLALMTSFTPSRHASHATLSGALHWIVDHNYHKINYCKNAIMVYNMDTENFFTMPHPGDQCFLLTRHDRMYLFERERNLCFCDLGTDPEVVRVWILMDYANRTWVNKYKVSLDLSLRTFPMEKLGLNYDIKLLNIWKDELFLDWKNRGIFRCHLEKKNVRKIKCPKIKLGVVERVYSSAFTKSLATLV